jgi:hypothetical protein
VELTGFGTKQFQASIDTLHRLRQTLARQVPEGAMEKLAVGQINGFDTIQLATRYFTSRHDDPSSTPVPFDILVDPKGIMEGLSDETYFHSSDNEVLYYTLKTGGGTNEPR